MVCFTAQEEVLINRLAMVLANLQITLTFCIVTVAKYLGNIYT